MAGNGRFEFTSASCEHGFAGNYPDGLRRNLSGPNLDKSGSFREGAESRMFGSGMSMLRGSGSLTGDLPLLSQSLMLEPIVMGEQKYTRSGELRRVLGISVRSASEDISFGTTHLKPSPSLAMEELNRFRASVIDTCIKARGRKKKFEELLHKVNKYDEAVASKKQQRNEPLTNERSAGSHVKMGIQIQRNSPEVLTEKLEDRPRNVVLNKRVRTSVVETRAEYRSTGLSRQSSIKEKNQDMLKDCGAESNLVEEKIHRLSAGGEGWDRKMKRKRSVGTAVTRTIGSDVELKRTTHHKHSSEPGLQSCDGQTFRSRASNGTGDINILDETSLPAGSGARATSKIEQEKAPLPRDLTAGLTKEKLLIKGSNKLDSHGDINATSRCPVTKGKASRTSHTGTMVATISTPNNLRVSGTLESWEQPQSVIKIPSIGGANNRKCAMPSGSSSPPMAQWGGRRPHKISRTRGPNMVSPVSNHDEMQTSSEGCSPSDFGARLTSGGTNSSLLSSAAANQQYKVELENVSSPARLSESEESGTGENRPKEKVISSREVEEKVVNVVQNVGPSAMLTKKRKLLIKEEIGDGVRRQGRSGRHSSFSKASLSTAKEKLDNAALTKPLRSTRPTSDKTGSKLNRPLNKLSDRKGFSRFGNAENSSSSDINGDLEDDREELLAAANFACTASYRACCSPFWKKIEPLFASISLEDRSYLIEQLKNVEEVEESRYQMFYHESKVLVDIVHEKVSASDIFSEEKNRCLQNKIGSKDSARIPESIDQSQDTALFGPLESGRRFNKVTPMYHRVLSALIFEEYEEIDAGRNVLLQNATGESPYDACLLIDAEPRREDKMELECESMLAVQRQEHGTGKRLASCNGNTAFHTSPDTQNPPFYDALLVRDSVHMKEDVEVLAGISRNDLDVPRRLQKRGFGILPFDFQYEQMCLDDKLLMELQSIGLYPEAVPDLDDRDDAVLNEEIVQLKGGLYEQIGKKKTCLGKIYKTIQGGRQAQGRDLEQIAMDELVELAFKKLLATRQSSAAKNGVAKVSKQVALAFLKRALVRCNQFEASGTSCFNKPELREIIFATPSRGNEAEYTTCARLEVSKSSSLSNAHCTPSSTIENLSDLAFAKRGPISNRGKKKEVFVDDVVGSAALRTTSFIGSSLLGGTKGKRSERERDKDTSTRNSVSKSGRSTLGSFKCERKTKMKLKQKTAQLSASGNGFVSRFMETTHPASISASGSTGLVNTCGNKKREDGLMSLGNMTQYSPKDVKEPMHFANLQLHELDPIEQLNGGTELGGTQDLSSWLNFDEDGLQDHDSMGLEIPMDDLTELNMF